MLLGIFEKFDNHKKSSVEYHGQKLDIQTFEYSNISIRKSKRKRYEARIETMKHLPNMFLDSHFKDKLSFRNNGSYYRQDQKINLEGDFNNFFQAYVPIEYQSYALEFLTPDILDTLVTYLPSTDVLIMGGTIKLTTQGEVEKETYLLGIEEFAKKVARFIKYLKSDEINFHKDNPLGSDRHGVIKVGSSQNSVRKIIYAVAILSPIILVLSGAAYNAYSLGDVVSDVFKFPNTTNGKKLMYFTVFLSIFNGLLLYFGLEKGWLKKILKGKIQ